MGAGEWIAVGSIVVTVGLALSGGFIGWMVSVVKNLASIKENTGHLATRIDEFEDTCHDISSTLRDHADRIGNLDLKVNTLEQHRFGGRSSMGS